MANISQIQVGTITYNIDAVTLGGKTYNQIVDLVNTAQFVVCTSAADTPKGVKWVNGSTTVTGTLEAASADSNNIYLVSTKNGANDNYDEYVAIGTTTKTWEKIGNTDVDLSGYVKHGTYATGAASASSSGSAGAATLTTSSSGSQTATGSATITYSKATGTGSAGSATVTANTNAATPAITATTSFAIFIPSFCPSSISSISNISSFCSSLFSSIFYPPLDKFYPL